MGPRDGLHGIDSAVHEIRAGAAVDMQIHVAGNQIAAGKINGLRRFAGNRRG